MKSNQDSTSTKISASETFSKALLGSSQSHHTQLSTELTMAPNHHDSTENVIQAVGEKKKAFEMTMRFFCYQVATSSFSNIIGTILGHPLDTVRVSYLSFKNPSSFFDEQ